jgi:uncharacterized protein (TIGR02001 family)
MRYKLMAAALAFVAASPANAADIDVTGFATVATEGIGRGFSITLEDPFYSVGATIQSGGAYVNATTQRFKIAGAGNETYVIAGYAHQVGKLTLDTSVVRYMYDSKAAADFWEGAITLRHPVGRATVEVAARGSIDYFANAGRALYTYADVSAPVLADGKNHLSVGARLGREEVEKNQVLGAPDWTYWTAGLTYRRGQASVNIAYHDTDIPDSLGLPAGGRVVAGLTLTL